MQDQSHEFEKLRQLLAFKRRENPPPGYFATFSSRVVQRLENESAELPAGWFRRLLQALQLRPGISVAFGMASVLVLVAATTLFEANPAGSAAQLPTMDGRITVAADPGQAAAHAAGALMLTNLGLALEAAPVSLAATNNSLFATPFYDRIEPNLNLRVEPARFDHRGE